jgi:hypothetical protein
MSRRTKSRVGGKKFGRGFRIGKGNGEVVNRRGPSLRAGFDGFSGLTGRAEEGSAVLPQGEEESNCRVAHDSAGTKLVTWKPGVNRHNPNWENEQNFSQQRFRSRGGMLIIEKCEQFPESSFPLVDFRSAWEQYAAPSSRTYARPLSCREESSFGAGE